MKKTIFVLLVVLVHVVACASSSAPSAPAAVRTNAPGELTPAFQAMRTLLVQGSDARQRCDAPFLRCLSPRLAATGLALLRARMPHDLRRADVARYHEGRAVFGGALKVWVGAVEAGADADVLRAFDGLFHAYWGWVDAAKGLPPERAV